MNEEHLIFGIRAVIEAVEAGKEIEKIFIQKGLSNELYHQLRQALRGVTIPIQIVPTEKLKKLTDKNHQGVIAYLTEINYFNAEELLSIVYEKGKVPLILILDRVTDVRNFGAIARGAECAGVDFIIIPSRGSALINGDAIKTSAGALHRVKVCREDNLKNTLGEVLSNHHKKQIRIAETEKYPHVTFFFNGGREVPFEGESRIMAPSPKVATYDLQPEMSAQELTDKLLPEINSSAADFICLNYANADMVGHTGIFSAVVKALETVDKCVEQIVTAGLNSGYTIFVTADHGNADFMINEDGSPNTAHTTNLVPFFIIDKDWKGTIQPGKLGDIAPTILTMMDLPIPAEMTGNVLI